ncbi:MAG TPA: endolytic transglycosylase MltG [Lachnospiraceae bacterium]|nr:endolytic transglycosylase MltG [Lachnospiraceae bacterium]
MNTKQIMVAVFGTVLKVAIAAVVILLVYKGAVIGYDYGFRVFKEEPVAESPGMNVQVDITVGKGAMQIGELLESKGLIRDARLFYVQNFLSHYKNALKPGSYVLNTSMTMSEMMEVMSPQKPEETTEGTESIETGVQAPDESTSEEGSVNDNG